MLMLLCQRSDGSEKWKHTRVGVERFTSVLSVVGVVVDAPLPPPSPLVLLLLPFCDFLLDSEPAVAVVPVPVLPLAVDVNPPPPAPPGTVVELPINKTLAIDRLEEPMHISNEYPIQCLSHFALSILLESMGALLEQ